MKILIKKLWQINKAGIINIKYHIYTISKRICHEIVADVTLNNTYMIKTDSKGFYFYY